MYKSKTPAIVGAVVVVIIGIILVIAMSGGDDDKKPGNNRENGNNSVQTLTPEEAYKTLRQCASEVNITENHSSKGSVSYDGVAADEQLPDIEKSYPIVVQPSGKEITAEIFCSPEKAGTGTDGWLRELAQQFNNDNITVNGKSAGIVLRSITSGTQIDYIESGVYVPDAFTPSASMWGEMLKFSGVETEVLMEKMVGNTAGVLLDKSTYNSLKEEYGEVNIQTVISATEKGSITSGYTNPFSSTSGLNFLAATLYSYDQNDPLSAAAVDGFNKFQNNVPFVAYSTLQMRDAAANSTFTCFINEYQSYLNNTDLKNNYEFLPYGIRHDNPLYMISGISSEKKELLTEFSAYCSSAEAVKKAKSYGFDQMDDYKDGIPATDGKTWSQMQKIWKKNKNAAKPIAAVFVLDTSGSMSGAPMNALKSSLSNSIKYINSTNYVGVISYANDINVDLPIGKFDINQQAYFQGAVDQLMANGTTSTFSAIAHATVMLEDFKKDNPNVQPMIFLLSDGEQNTGCEYSSITSALKTLSVPVYTIGYNADLEELRTISSLNEAASIDADNDDVVYQLKNLFNANL